VGDALYSLDVTLFVFLNQTIANPVGDILWPIITNYDRFLVVRVVLLLVWIGLLLRGGPRGRRAALLLIPVLVFADQLSSSVLKELIARPRPCHSVAGIPIVESVRLLVDCGPGKSFPSSHAVNNFAVATVFAWSYPAGRWWFFGWAALVALSRPAVGVHYPSDIVGGALIGSAVALLWIQAWLWIEGAIEARRSPPSPPEPSHE
jgi:undecaprenyl-diphosphatase